MGIKIYRLEDQFDDSKRLLDLALEIISNSLDGIEKPEVDNNMGNLDEIESFLEMAKLANEKYPSHSFTPENFPVLFKDVEDSLRICFVTNAQIMLSKKDKSFLVLHLETKKEFDDKIPTQDNYGLNPQQAIDIGKNLQSIGEEIISGR